MASIFDRAWDSTVAMGSLLQEVATLKKEQDNTIIIESQTKEESAQIRTKLDKAKHELKVEITFSWKWEEVVKMAMKAEVI